MLSSWVVCVFPDTVVLGIEMGLTCAPQAQGEENWVSGWMGVAAHPDSPL